jgi:ADP-dependent NAD(P)H-hydrate dehydratase / NAD(P)H-hydrate epimerase
VVGGSAGMRGAALLAALGAQAVGAGRVFVGRPGGGTADGLDPQHPELMVRKLGDGKTADTLGSATAIAVGCGLGTGPAARRLVSNALDHPATLVIDADALNILSADDALRARLAARAAGTGGEPRAILTPHPLEAARLLGIGTADVQRDRIAAACAIAARTGTLVVLKGAGTVVAAPDGYWTINGSGNPILAVAGTGDVLAGVIAGLVAIGLEAPIAARLGVWLHGAAGDALAGRTPHDAGIGMPASTLSAAIRAQINRLAAARC